MLRRLRSRGYGAIPRSVQRGVALVALAGELAVVFWGSWTLLSLRPSGRRRLVVLMFAAGALVHLITLSDSRHRLGLELLFFLVAGCRFQPLPMLGQRARQALLLTAAVAVLGLLTPGRQQLFDLLF